MPRTIVLLLLTALALAACAGGAKPEDAPKVVEEYLKAKAAADGDKLLSLACADQEQKARDDATSFASVKAELQDASCRQSGSDGDTVLVACEGQIHVDYGGETRDFPLSGITYRVVDEDGEWKWCGEQ